MTAAPRPAARLLLLLPAAAIFALYWPALQFGYVWDDPDLLSQLPAAGLGELWRAIWQPFLAVPNYLRPLPLLTLGLEKMSGAGAALAHFDNLLLHAANSTLTALLAAALLQRRGATRNVALAAGACAGLLYALHPALVEAAAWISVRPDLLVTGFCLAALLCDLTVQTPARRALAVGGLFLLAALSKEMALGWALLLPLWHFASAPPGMPAQTGWRRALPARNHAVLGAVAVAGLVYLCIRALALPALVSSPTFVQPLDGADHAVLVLMTLGRYAAETVFPFAGLSPLHYYRAPLSLGQPDALAGIAVLVCAGIAWRSAARGNRGAALAGCWLLSLLPVLNLARLDIGDNYAHERFLALPLVFWCLGLALAALAWWQQPQRRALLLAAGAGLIAACACVIVIKLPVWRDNLSLWQAALERAPRSWAAQSNLYVALVKRDQLEAAHALADGLRARFPGEVNPMLEAGDALMLDGHGQGALAESTLASALERGKELTPAYRAYLLEKLGMVRLMHHDHAGARAALAQALAVTDEPESALYFLGVAELALGDSAAGEKHLQSGLALMPEPRRSEQRAKAEDFLREAKGK